MKVQIIVRSFLFLVVLAVGFSSVFAQEGESQAVKGGGVLVNGWTGKIDPK
jgi:hypothetical protein